jgi:hypothetical protein
LSRGPQLSSGSGGGGIKSRGTKDLMKALRAMDTEVEDEETDISDLDDELNED